MIIRSKTPLRLGLAGGGTDVSPFCDIHHGCVLNVTINMYSYCTIEPENNGKVVFVAPDREEYVEYDSKHTLEIDNRLPLHVGIYNRIVKDYNNNKPLSFRMTTYSDAPAGSGLGTSSTMVVTIIKAYMEWLNLPLGEYDIARLAFEIERNDLGFAGGKQDQYAATFGGLNYMEFFDNNRVIVNPLRMKKWIKNEIENSLFLYYTGTSRDSGKIIEEQTKATKNEKSLEAMFDIKNQTNIMKECLLKGDFDGVANCLNLNWEAKKKTASVISNPLIEETHDFIMNHGGKACKISGAGGGGFMIVWCDPKDRYQLIKNLKKRNEGRVKIINFVEIGTQAWTLYDEESK